MYRSSYSEEVLDVYARQMLAAINGGLSAWCIFDNTAASNAIGNALSLMARVLSSQMESGKHDKQVQASRDRDQPQPPR